MNQKYIAGKGSRLSTKEVPIVVAEVTRLIQAHGSVTPQLIVDEARSVDNPLHKFFEWDIQKAAEQHWLEQARSLLRSVDILVQTDEGKKITTRAFIHVSDEGHYQAIADVFSEPMSRARLLAQAKKELAEWKARYRDLEELAHVIAAIERAA